MMQFLRFSCPSASFVIQQGVFVPCDCFSPKGPLYVLNYHGVKNLREKTLYGVNFGTAPMGPCMLQQHEFSKEFAINKYSHGKDMKKMYSDCRFGLLREP